jgi:ABC-2 type transport system ATP-binding protein
VIDNGEIVAEGSPDSLKARVSGDGVKIGVPAESVSAAAAIAAKLAGAHELTTTENAVRFRVPRGDTAMPELLRALDAAGITMQSMQVTRPTLDDVFLTMTGRSLRDAEQATPATEESSHVA